MLKELYCRPGWFPGSGFPHSANISKYKAIQVPKDSEEIEEIFCQKYLDKLPENYIWKIITSREPVYRSQEDFHDEFDIIKD